MDRDPYLEKAFSRLDQWRHLPAYRLEPRADVFFAAFLPELLHAKLGHYVREPIIPEFPLRRGLLYGEDAAAPDASVKVDYLAVSQDGSHVYLVELKTDPASRRTEQDEYLDLAVKTRVAALVQGVVEIVGATKQVYLPKYMHLLRRMEQLGWLELPEGLVREVCAGHLSGARARLRGIKVLIADGTTSLAKVYVQPEADSGICCISFREAAEVVTATGSPMGKLFAEHLIRWVDTAGAAMPDEVCG